jgi:hypothetical protein
VLALAATLACPAAAQEAVIRKNLAERLPEFPKIDEVSKTPIPGVWELRVGNDLFYTDDQGNHIIQGSLYDTRAKVNLTEQRVEKLTAIDFDQLPFKDAMRIGTIVTGAEGMKPAALTSCSAAAFWSVWMSNKTRFGLPAGATSKRGSRSRLSWTRTRVPSSAHSETRRRMLTGSRSRPRGRPARQSRCARP